VPQAFGAGALLAALSVELVVGAAMGGILFFLLDQLVNAHGGFLRKTSTSITYFRIDRIRPLRFNDGEVIFNRGDTAHSIPKPELPSAKI